VNFPRQIILFFIFYFMWFRTNLSQNNELINIVLIELVNLYSQYQFHFTQIYDLSSTLVLIYFTDWYILLYRLVHLELQMVVFL
jgi:hypothetical protein